MFATRRIGSIRPKLGLQKMLLTTDQTIIIKATVPILETGGETLTKHFYANMLKDHPVVVPFFNKAHQASGDQPRALANAVLMYAKNIERLEKMGPLVNQIINKHVSLDINPAHYAIVGSCLLKAIREVLGKEIATDAVIDAWGAAYGQLADILIGAEKNLQEQKASAPGGWMGNREFVVKDKVVESSEITSFLLAPADGGAVLAHEAGQYLGLHLHVDNQEVRRNYSISCAANGDHYRISVKREPGGVVSTHLHDAVSVGHKLKVHPPAGDFTLKAASDATKPIVFLTAGVGITPAMAMLQESLAMTSSRPVRFIHCAKTADHQAFRATVQDICAKHSNVSYYTAYSDAQPAAPSDSVVHGLLSKDQLARWLPSDRDAEVFFLGPKAFMATMKRNLLQLGVPEKQLHWEFFGPAADLDKA
eukprot:Colp12_sorted_trinity150504_noHs@7559